MDGEKGEAGREQAEKKGERAHGDGSCTAKDFFHDFMNYPASQENCRQINQDSRKDSNVQRNLVKNRLNRRMIGGYVKHVGIRFRTGDRIDEQSHEAAGQKNRNFCRPVPVPLCGETGKSAEDSNKKEKKMPEEPVKRQGPVGIQESRWKSQGKNSAQDSKILQKRGQNGTCRLPRCQRKKQAEVHGGTAELKRKIPPVVVKSIQIVKEALFVDFHKSQNQAACKQDTDGFFLASVHSAA